jgi:hypothetical protein
MNAVYQVGLDAAIVAVFLNRDQRDTALKTLRAANPGYWWQDVMVTDTTARQLRIVLNQEAQA